MQDFLSQNIYLDYACRILASLVCGLILGVERKKRQHTVGIRTLSTICLSACLLSILSSYQAACGSVTGDPTRITAGVVTGVGFLGAGTIVNQGLNIRGLTSAAIIFIDAALGVACGAGLYYPAALVLIITMVMLFLVTKFERKYFPAEKRKIIRLGFKKINPDEKTVRKILEKNGFVVHDLDISTNYETKHVVLKFTAKTPDSIDYISLTNQLSELSDLVSIDIDK